MLNDTTIEIDYLENGISFIKKQVSYKLKDDGYAYLKNGNFIQPTIFSDVKDNMKIAREEIFGPVLCVIKFSTEEEAIAIANDTDYGLSAGIWSADVVGAQHAVFGADGAALDQRQQDVGGGVGGGRGRRRRQQGRFHRRRRVARESSPSPDCRRCRRRAADRVVDGDRAVGQFGAAVHVEHVEDDGTVSDLVAALAGKTHPRDARRGRGHGRGGDLPFMPDHDEQDQTKPPESTADNAPDSELALE